MTPASFTGERVGFVSLKRFLLMETGDVFVHKPYDAHSMITKVGTTESECGWVGHNIFGQES